MAIKSFSVRIDENTLHQLHQVADYEGRFTNKQICILIQKCIEKYRPILFSEKPSDQRVSP